MRKETDFLGTVEIPENALYGIHTVRARQNFPDVGPFPLEWYKAVGMVKRACYQTYHKYKRAVVSKHPDRAQSFCFIEDDNLENLIASATEVSEGLHFDHFIVPGISGGAGTSINMNVNEIIANLSLLRMGRKCGDYHILDPIEHANVFQSTNDVIPTALKVTVMQLLNDLEQGINEMRASVEEKEKAHQNHLRIGYTQMQEAVPTSYGKLFSTYSEALSRDWWRVSKCFERIKLVNLGGGAVGSALAIPRFFVMEATSTLQKLTGLQLARSENLADATSNLDSFVEIHATLKAHAVNLEKMVSDIRLLSSDIHHAGPVNELSIPKVQVGSSIMPGKVNPVIPEFVISAAHRIYANDQVITSLSAQGCLELNAYLPVIGCSLIESLKLLIAMDKTIKQNLMAGLIVNHQAGWDHLLFSPSISTALIPFTGYNKAAEVATLMKSEGLSIFEANDRLKLVSMDKLNQILAPENLLKLGYTLQDIM